MSIHSSLERWLSTFIFLADMVAGIWLEYCLHRSHEPSTCPSTTVAVCTLIFADRVLTQHLIFSLQYQQLYPSHCSNCLWILNTISAAKICKVPNRIEPKEPDSRLMFVAVCSIMTSFLTADENLAQNSNPVSRPKLSRNQTVENKKKSSQFLSVPGSFDAVPFSAASNSNADITQVVAGSSSGTRPKTRIRPEVSGSSSDDAVFHPQKSKVRNKTKVSPESETERSVIQRTHYSQSSSSEIEGSVIDTENGKVLANQKNKSSRGKTISSSTLAGPNFRARNQRSKTTQARTKFAVEPIRQIPPFIKPESDISQGEIPEFENIRGNVRNQSQNTEVKGLDKTFSTVENEVFLKRVEEVLSEIVEEKKRRIVEAEKNYATLKPRKLKKQISSGRLSFDHEGKDIKKTADRWIFTKHFDTSDHSSTFSHIITSHGIGRLRRRSKSSDILETHDTCFTKLEPYKPRILRKDPKCRLIEGKNTSVRESISVSKHISTPGLKRGENNNSRAETPQTDDQKSSTIEENLSNITTNTEADDTCYESENGESECALDFSVEPLSPTKLSSADQADASVDSAYTGSRGPTPDNPDNLRIRTLRHKLHHRPRQEQKINEEKRKPISQQDIEQKMGIEGDVLDKIRKEIIAEIREIGVYSDYSITTLLDLYKRKYLHIPKKDMEDLVKQVKIKFGLVSEEDDDVESEEEIKKEQSPKKSSRVKFVEELEVTGDHTLQTDSWENKRLCEEEERVIMPEEALDLQEVLNKTKRGEEEAVRWLTQEEIVEAKWASQILTECGIADQSTKILETAKTWEEVSQALGFTSPFFNTVECGHEDEKECGSPCVSNFPTLNEIVQIAMPSQATVKYSDRDDCRLEVASVNSKTSCFNSALDQPAEQIEETNNSPCLKIEESQQARSIDSFTSSNTSSIDSVIFRERESSCELTNLKLSVDENLECSTNSENTTEDKIADYKNMEITQSNNSTIPPIKTDQKIDLTTDEDFFDDPSSSQDNSDMNTMENEIVRDTDNVHGSFSSSKHSLNPFLNDVNSTKLESNATDALMNPFENSDITENISGTSEQSEIQVRRKCNPMPAIISDNMVPFHNSDERESPDNFPSTANYGDSEHDDVALEQSIDPLRASDQVASSLKLAESAQQSATKEEFNKLQMAEVPVLKPQEDDLNLKPSNSNSKDINNPTNGHQESQAITGNGSIPKQSFYSLGDEIGGSTESQAAISPTQPSLKGKIAALAAAYSSKAEDTPEWLSVADEVCKQFDITL